MNPMFRNLILSVVLYLGFLAVSFTAQDAEVKTYGAARRAETGAPPQIHSSSPNPGIVAPSNPGAMPAPTRPNAANHSPDVYYPGYYPSRNPYYPNRCEAFYGSLISRYGTHYPDLFPRVQNDRELFLTSKSVKAALKDPVNHMKDMLTAFAELQKILQNPSPDPTSRKEVKRLTSKIRTLASKIRGDIFLNLLDMRKETDLLNEKDKSRGSAELAGHLEKLRNLIFELNRELTSMYNSKTPGVVSVKSYSGASFKSLAHGIEKLTKRIESNT